ncbi:MAG: hypothetical protein EA395_14980, partial [Phormidium sp. GEM2.Bin31]
MTEFSDPTPPTDPQREPQPPRRRRALWAIAILLLTVLAGGTIWGWRFVQYQLAPLLSEELGKLLERPIEVGELDRVSLTHVRFGESQVLPSEDQPSQASIEAVHVGFNLVSLLWSRTLPLDVRLEEVDVTIPQLEDGNWATTDIREPGEPGFIQIQLNRIRIDGGSLTVIPQPKPEFNASQPLPNGETPEEETTVNLLDWQPSAESSTERSTERSTDISPNIATTLSTDRSNDISSIDS